ncbi:MAG: hypothetical protein J6U41_09230, partial [Lachnospiraceae bacterium]|nr:hypothetical protein [Lachnospiraceae bacterium]
FMGFLGIQCSQMVADILSAVISVPFVIKFLKSIPSEDISTIQDEKYAGYVKGMENNADV